MEQREPGWYRDPDDTRVHRYWDGSGWTMFLPSVHRLVTRPQSAEPRTGSRRSGYLADMTTTPAEPVQDPAYAPVVEPGEDPGVPPDTQPDPATEPEPQPA